MSKIINNLKIGLDEDLAEKLQWLEPHYTGYRILRQSVDARTRHNPHFVMTVEVAPAGSQLPELKIEIEPLTIQRNKTFSRPIIVGAGPAGLFAALRLVERGIPCLLLERGSSAEERIKGISRFWRHGELDPRNNVCFGEGGAGLYSDGKLITRIKSPHIPYIMDRLVKFGAPEEIKYLSNPHVGSDRIRRVIPKLRQFLLENGCQIRFNTRVKSLILSSGTCKGVVTEYGDAIHSDHTILATGHSAEDILNHLFEMNVHCEGKSFAMGLRIEHPQAQINKIQYREAWNNPKLGSANYKLADHDSKNNIGVYSFCMCPGGYVLSSGTEIDRLVCNGMSNYNRNSPFANAAIVVSIDHNRLFGDNLQGGLKMRQELEQEAYKMVLKSGGKKELPAQNLIDFLNQKESAKIRIGSSPSGAVPTRLDQLLPQWIRTRMIDSLRKFDRNMKGFLHEDAVLYGIESRTSCPIRIVRHSETLQSTSHSGLYPCGEGAGYAGGITSAACDGVSVAEQIVKSL